MAAATMTIESYVADMVGSVVEGDTDELVEISNTLLKMKSSAKPKHRLNYWRVQQCLGETAMDVLLKYLSKVSKVARKRKNSDKYFDVMIIMEMLLDSLSNIAVIKRLLLFKVKLSPLLFQSVRQSEYGELIKYGFAVMYRLLIVGKLEVGEYLVKYGILKDIYLYIKHRNDSEDNSNSAIIEVNLCTKVLRNIAACASDNIRKQIRFSTALRCLSEYVGKLRKCCGAKAAFLNLSGDLCHITLIVTDDKAAHTARDTWHAKELLLEDLELDKLYLFCSSPSCRKIYVESKMEKFRYCGACRLARYCGQDCQRSHWKEGHKKACLGEARPAQLT